MMTNSTVYSTPQLFLGSYTLVRKRTVIKVFFITVAFTAKTYSQDINAIDPKGTLWPINWSLNGTSIHNNNMGNVGVGTTSPDAKLEVDSGVSGESGIRTTQANNTTPTTQTAAKVFAVDADGDLVLEHTTTAVNTISGSAVDFDAYAHHWLDISTNATLTVSGTGALPFVSLRVRQSGAGTNTLTLGGQVDVTGVSYAPGIGAGIVTFYQFGWNGTDYEIVSYYTR